MGFGYKAVTGVRTLSDYCLLLTFEGGETRVFDYGADIAPETLYEESIPAAGAVANRITMADSG